MAGEERKVEMKHGGRGVQSVVSAMPCDEI
jgi:hypothetical protein